MSKKKSSVLIEPKPTLTSLDAALEAAYDQRPQSHEGPRRIAALMLSIDTPWTLHDKAWFAKNRTRSHRLRRLFVGERPAPVGVDDSTHTIIRQFEPGQRDKLFVGDLAGGETLDDFPDDENLIAALWTRVAAAKGQFTVADVLSDALQTESLIRDVKGPQ